MVLKYLKCPKCEYKATDVDYLCPRCQSKFRPRSVLVISAVMLILGILNLSIIQVVFAIGLFLMKQWARRWLIIGIIGQLLLVLFLAGLDLSTLRKPEYLASLSILVFVFIPIAIYLLKNEEIIEAFEFYGGKL